MSEKNDLIMEYDEDESVRFIQEHLPKSMKDAFSKDEINYVVDLIYDFYDDKGFLDESEESEVVIDEAELIAYVIKNAHKDKVCTFTDEQIEAIVEGELAYCDSLHIFE